MLYFKRTVSWNNFTKSPTMETVTFFAMQLVSSVVSCLFIRFDDVLGCSEVHISLLCASDDVNDRLAETAGGHFYCNKVKHNYGQCASVF